MSLRNLLADSHYKMPWIIWKAEYQVEVNSADWKDVSFPHNLPFTPLLIGQWSNDAGFRPAYDIGIQVPDGHGGGQPRIASDVYADRTKIYVQATNNTNSKLNFYYRLMAYASNDYTGEVNPVDYSSSFRYNSHYNYQKILLEGFGRGTVRHNLGYLPQARVWIADRNAGTAWPGMATITENELIGPKDAEEDAEFYYHIYGDAMNG